MSTVNIHHAKTHLSRLVEEVAAGAEIVISKNGVPRAKLVPLEAPRRLKFGVIRESFVTPTISTHRCRMRCWRYSRVAVQSENPARYACFALDAGRFSKLPKSARELIGAPETECFVSAVSFWEIAIKAALRRTDFRVDTTALVGAATRRASSIYHLSLRTPRMWRSCPFIIPILSTGR